MKEIFLPFRYEDCRALLFDLFALQLLDQWQCAVMIQKLSCKASLKPPHPFTHTGPGHLFCLSFISSRLLGSADLCALTTTYPVTSSPSLDATNLNTSMVTITHTYTVNIPTYKSSVDEKGLEDKKNPKKHSWLVGTMSRRPCMALSFHMCVNLCVYVSVVNWWCGISKVTCMFTCSSVFFFFFIINGRWSSKPNRKGTKRYKRSNRTYKEKNAKGEENDARSRRTPAPPTANFSVRLCLHFYYLIAGESHFLHPNSVENNLERIGQEHGCCVDRLWVWAGWGGETCLLEMWENGRVSGNGCVDSLIGGIELLS